MSDRRQLGVIDRSVRSVTLTRTQAWYVDWSIDILLYTVVLNLFVEHVDGVVIDSFTISLLTAILLKVMLVLKSRIEEPVSEYFSSKGTAAAKVAGSSRSGRSCSAGNCSSWRSSPACSAIESSWVTSSR